VAGSSPPLRGSGTSARRGRNSRKNGSPHNPVASTTALVSSLMPIADASPTLLPDSAYSSRLAQADAVEGERQRAAEVQQRCHHPEERQAGGRARATPRAGR
jgi:hypothetical protein